MPVGSCATESAGKTVDFFDFGIVKSPDFVSRGTLTYVPILRDNGPLLSFTSAHQTRLHIAWPVGYVKRLHRRASSIVGFRAARDQFVTRLQLSGAPQILIQYITDNTDYFRPYNQTCNVKRHKVDTERFLVLPFHPLWQLARLPSIVASFSQEPQHRRLLQEAFASESPFPVTVSWKLQSVPLGASLVEW